MMLERIIGDSKVKASFWGLVVAVLVAAGNGFVNDSEASRILETVWPILLSVGTGLGLGWATKKPPELPPGGANHG